MAKPGRRPVLDAFKKREILAILTVGCGRRTAALYVGCAPSTIRETARRDPEFAAELARAEQAAEIALVTNIRRAAMDVKYWRAAAWALERCHPDRYGSRGAHTLSVEQIRALLKRFAQDVIDELPDPKHRQAVLRHFGRLAQELRAPQDESDPDDLLLDDPSVNDPPSDDAEPDDADEGH